MTTKYRSILVPLDGSPFAEQALPLATELARRSNAILQLALVHHPVAALVTSVDVPDAAFEVDNETRSSEQHYLDAVVERVGKQHRPVTGVVLEGSVAEALESQIVATATDLVVSTTHGRGHLGRFWLGSVTDQLMRHLHVPLILVRPDERHPRPAETGIQCILVALDGSPFAEQALEQATTLALASGASLELVYVLQPSLPIADPTGLVVIPASPEGERVARQRAQEYLDPIARDLVARGLPVICRVIDGSGVAATLLEQAKVSGANLIALASHGLGGVQRLLLGSVADQVIRGSTVPVLVIRPS